MKIEIYDIQDHKRAEAWAEDLPPGATLGQVFAHEKLAGVDVIQVKVNGVAVTDWRSYSTAPGDHVYIAVMPGAAALPYIYYAIQIALAVASVVSFIVGLFQKPNKPEENRASSPTYTFEGIQDTFEPGNPISLTYGKQRKGGQVLMYFLQMLPDRSGLYLNMLLSFGEGPVDAIEDIEINEISVSALDSISITTRLGTSNQPMFEPFQQIANTFHDGREITNPPKNGRENTTGNFQSSIVYRTVGHNVAGLDIFVAALEGLTCVGKSSGTFYPQWSRYRIEIHDSGLGTNECSEITWQGYTERTIHGKYQQVYWDTYPIRFPYASRWDVKLTWLDARCHPRRANPGTFTYRLFLQEATELRGTMSDVHNEALLGITAAPTHDLHGGRPNVTAIVRGLKPDVYTSVTSFTNRWTQNPAWAVADYMTNSRYGMGAYITKDDLDIQSFLDFATLADSLIGACDPTNPGTFTAAGNCDGSNHFHTGDAPQGDGGFHTSGFANPDECVGMWSKYDGQEQYGVCLNRVCCPPLDSCYGVFSGEAACEWAEHWATITKIDTGSPVVGFVAWVGSGSTPDNFRGYGAIYHHGSKTISAVRWNNQSVNTFGTILLSVPTGGAAPGFFDLVVEPAYTNWPSSKDWYNNDNTTVKLYIENSAGATMVETEVTDTSSLRFTKGGCGGLAEQGIGGIVVMANPSGGDYHGVHLEGYNHECGLCYGGCGISAGGCPCDLDGPSSGTAIRHWDNTCHAPVTRFNETPNWRAFHLAGYQWPVGP